MDNRDKSTQIQIDFIIDTWGVAPRTAELMVEAEVQPVGPTSRRVQREILRKLISDKNFFNATDDPETLRRAFQTAQRNGFYPPRWTLEALSSGFKHLNEGRPDFIQWGIGTKTTSGNDTALRKLAIEKRNFILLCDILMLCCHYGKSKEAAYEVVATKMDNGEYPEVNSTRPLSKKSLERILLNTPWAKEALVEFKNAQEALKEGNHTELGKALLVDSLRQQKYETLAVNLGVLHNPNKQI